VSRLAERVRVFLELVKFEHSIFALPYAFIGALYGAASLTPLVIETFPPQIVPANIYVTVGAWPRWGALLWITVAMVGARSFAFAVNRAVDKEIDSRNPRTAGRAIPAGLVKAWELWLFAAVVLAAYLVAVYQLAPVTHWLWPIPLAAFIIYPYTKRFTWLCHWWLGLCLGLAPIGGWAAVTNSVAAWAPWVMGLAVTLWTAGFDIIYATQDVECDIRDGIHSVPADLGVARALDLARWDHAATVALLVLAGMITGAGFAWFVGVVVATLLLVYENSLVSALDLTRVDAAFFTVNGVIAIVVFGGALADRLISAIR
jgi:4-hydroxybenzoate polyprenyltransferase